jgi:ABC-type transport system involved in cytochrome c biogenesis permease subunit
MLLASLGAMVSLGAMAAPVIEGPAPIDWDDETLNSFATLPVQTQGRIKPLDSYAGFLLLRLNGKRTWKDLEGEKHGHLEWLVNTMLYPETARHYEVFLIRDSAILDAIGVDHTGKKRSDRYSYDTLAPGMTQLLEVARSTVGVDEKLLTTFQRQSLNLFQNIQEFEALMNYFNFALHPYHVNTSEGLRLIFEDAPTATYSEILANAKVLQRLLQGIEGGVATLSEEARAVERQALMTLFDNFLMTSQQPSILALLPPVGDLASDDRWLTPTGPPKDPNVSEAIGLWEKAFEPDVSIKDNVALLASLEKLPGLRENPTGLRLQISRFNEAVAAAATTRGEYAKIRQEVAFYKANYFFYALVGFIIAFVLSAILWLNPGSTNAVWRTYAWVPTIAAIVPAAVLTYGIVLRCIIRGRPPVSTLYETILFITAVAVVIGIIIEIMNRRRIAISVATLFGAFGMFLAYRYEIKEGVDTMPALRAVLDTNFWLATHVTTVTIGYAAGLLAALIAHVFLFGKLFGIKKNDKRFYTDLTRMVYGVTCFGLCFATVGTVLGGIWANDSWGRFWGWDPKENGALMIVLGGLAIIHGRLGGYLRQFGLHMAAIVLGGIVTFSWWGVNLLGVGLHSYGFTSGIFKVLAIYYAIECAVLLLGAFAWLREKNIIVIQGPSSGATHTEQLEAPGK